MKKTMILLVVAALFAMVGCSKSKTCNCTVTQNMPYVGPTTTTTTTTIEKGDCSDLNSTSTTTIEGITVTATMVCSEQ